MACGDRDSGGRPAPLLAGYESHRRMVPGTGSTGRIGVVIEQGLFEVMKVAGGDARGGGRFGRWREIDVIVN